MIRFLLNRPIAVLMAFTACFVVGLVTYFTLPVSLLPDIAIPEITVQASAANTSARELENTVIKTLRGQLMQLTRLRGMESDTRDGAGLIRLHFDYGTNTDLAFIEVNEKIDAAMNVLPKESERPKVVKASATDIPVFYLNLTLKSDSAVSDDGSTERDERAFLDLSNFAENVIKRRIEQLPEVAMVDITGVVSRQVQLIPDRNKMALLSLSVQDIEQALAQNNVEPGSMSVRDGYYEYNIKFSTLLRTREDVQNILLNRNGMIIRLGDFCRVQVVPVAQKGLSLMGGKRAVTLAVIKQADENMDNLKQAIAGSIDYFEKLYPDIDFHISRNQTELLDYTISNLQQNLAMGFLFIFLVAILFLGNVRSPLVIAISMTVSIVVSFLFFYLFDVSLNIISLAGLILALGMMIDSSIIVTENIAQYRERGCTLYEACVQGTQEVMMPMLSSSLTTVAVFVPLVFMSGIAGAIFYDQAFAVTVGLGVSYLTGVMLLPVLCHLLPPKPPTGKKRGAPIGSGEGFYEAGIRWVFAHKALCLTLCLCSLPLCYFMFEFIDKERMPQIDRNELTMRVEWNENIHVEENRRRVERLIDGVRALTIEQAASVAQQDYLLNSDRALSSSESELYFKTATSDRVEGLQSTLYRRVKQEYPQAVVSFAPPLTVFEKLFATDEADITVELYARNRSELPTAGQVRALESELTRRTGIAPTGIAFENQLNIRVHQEKLLLYRVEYAELYRVLKTAFRENNVATLHSYQQYLPIVLAGEAQTINDILQQTLVRTQADTKGEVRYIPLQELVSITPAEDLKSITAGLNGEYIPFRFYGVDEGEQLMRGAKQAVLGQGDDRWEVGFSGSYFSNRQMLGELVVILLVSMLLMFFILAAQFESFVQPLIVLIELPVDVGFALVLLWLCGHTLNLMSAIGLIVTCGIIINDSILKLDAINELRRRGVPLLDAIHQAGRRRLRPIIMTSLTTILAMVPLLFSSDMGSELQQPLSIAMIGTMSIGTLVSLFIIPLVYWYIYRNKAQTDEGSPAVGHSHPRG
ncbi:MAG: efflux RND transporter permease subunit [Prevotellaceae bacterium]|jgi:multidrug efflux pump subunit AcrB|nr:efflux RND transporter permease subunit [Prevotellaceae bacterium]